MKANDLRIGNWVFDIDSQSFKKIHGFFLENKEHYGLKPIKLTEGWLINYGFDYFKSNNSYQLDVDLGFSIWGRIESGFNVYVNSDSCGQTIKYVHQLQNLYFALTGKELKLNKN